MYILPEIVVYKDINFGGDSWRFNMPPGWGWSYVGDDWNDSISSVVVVSGTWQFFNNAGFDYGDDVVTIYPGYYSFVEHFAFGGAGMRNDTISSILCLSDSPQGDNPVVDPQLFK
jgi:hypothetical protein